MPTNFAAERNHSATTKKTGSGTTNDRSSHPCQIPDSPPRHPAAIPDLHKIPENDRLNPDQLSADIARLAGQGWYLPDPETIIARVKETAESGDIIAVLSNGGFGGIHEKLLAALA